MAAATIFRFDPPAAMTDAYQVLGLEQRLVIGRDELAAAFREAGKSAHPDAGGSEEQFAAVRAAHDLLVSPAGRLRHWLELRGHEVDVRGTVSPAMMDWFSRVGEVTQRCEVLLRKREAARTALGLAMLEAETHLCREEVEEMIASLEAAIATACEAFADLDHSPGVHLGQVPELLRDLSFLEKWRAGLRGLYARLA